MPRRLPLLGHLPWLARDPIGFLQGMRAHGDVVAFHLGPRKIHLVNSPELIRRVLVTDAAAFQRGAVFDTARQLLGDGLATADEPVHLRQRRVMQPAFHHDRMPAYLEVMRSQVDEITSAWLPGRPLRLDREMASLTLTVTAKALFRTELGSSAVAEVRRSLAPVLNGITMRAVIPGLWRVPSPALRRLKAVVDDVVGAYRRDGADHGDLLSMLVAADQMSDDEVRTQVMNILMAGTETTATTLSWACHELATHPDVAARVSDPEYLDRVLREVVRLHTPIWLLTRRAVAPVRLGAAELPPGAEVLVCLPTLHRDPALFPDPMRFDPDRWLVPEVRGSFIPFGAGGHKCIGDGFAWSEMGTALTAICARWRLEPVPGHRVREVARAFLRPNAVWAVPSVKT